MDDHVDYNVGGGDLLGFWTEEEAAHVPHEWAKQRVDCDLRNSTLIDGVEDEGDGDVGDLIAMLEMIAR